MSTPDSLAPVEALASGIAYSLGASGIPSICHVDDGGVWLVVTLDDRRGAGVVAWLDVSEGMEYAVTVGSDGTRRLVPHGPLAALEPCDDPRCVASQIVEWCLAWRAEHQP